MPVSPFATNFPTNWQMSVDAGANWTGAPAPTVSNQVLGPRGTQRFRQIFTIPAGLPGGTFSVTVGGDIWDGTVNDPAELLYDAVSQGTIPIAGSQVFTLPVVPGEHTLTLLIGAADDNGLGTAPSITFSFANVIPGVPCDCCPTGGPQCALVALRFDGVSETVSAAGWTQVNLPATIDGVTATAALSGYNSPGGTNPTPTPEVTYTLAVPHDRVRGLRLWNQGGGNLNDADGLGAFVADFYAGATLLATLPCVGVNGGGAQTFTFGSGVELPGVDRVVLRDLAKQQAGTVAPLWRELQLVEFHTVFPCRRRTGVMEWYDLDGNQIPTTDVVSCMEGGTPFVMPDLRLTGQFFGDGPDPAGENLCNVIPAPSAVSGFTAVGGGCFDPTVGNPTMDWVTSSSVELEYGNPPQTSGGVNVFFSSSLGTITWPTNNASMAVGEQRVSNVFSGNRRAVITYLSGPASTAPSQTIRMTGGSTLGIHLGTTDNTTPPIRFRLDFITT
jgi:hypothetical protein